MFYKLPREQLKEITSLDVHGISDNDRDEMAIPSYLHVNPLVRWLMVKRYEYIAELSDFSPQDVVLEFGCGIGFFLPTLSQSCYTVYAIDLFPQYAQALVAKLGLHVHFSNSVSELPDCSLDCVIAADVLEHFPEPSEVINEIRKKLKRTGRFIVSGPTENTAYKLGRIISGFANKGDYHHTDIDALIIKIRNSRFGLKVVKTLPFRFPPYLFKIALFEVN